MKAMDKVALVTGGGRGIGKAVALAYARKGMRVLICARTGHEIEQTVAEISGFGGAGFAVVCDVSQEEPVENLVHTVEKDFGRLDVLVNNAGVMTRPVSLEKLEVKKWDYTLSVNLRGTFLVTRRILPIMMRQGSGSIINVSSTIGRGAYANFSAYAASKWGIEGLTQTLATEVASQGIRVNSVDPGYVATKLTGFRGSRPESVTDVFLYLAADESCGVTGKSLNAAGWRSLVN
jgi:NAD(P)-dependent dehydrogenase (short-subunit alcohol dehydrogenase family)